MRGGARICISGVLLSGLVAMLSAPVRVAAAQLSEGTGRVVLEATTCPGIADTEIRRIVGIELGALLAPSGSSGALESHHLFITCEGQRAVVRVRARGPHDAPEPERQLLLEAFPGDAAPRALALAAIELLASVDVSVRETLDGTRAHQPVPEAPPRTSAVIELPSTSVAMVALRRSFLRPAGLGAWGGRVDVVHDRAARLRFVGDLEATIGSTMSVLGEARAVLVSTGWFGGLRASPAAGVTLSLVAGARAGMAAFQGTPSEGSGATAVAVWRPWWGPALSVRATVGGLRVAAVASIEGGLTARGAEALAGTTTVLAVRGGWVTAAAGIQF